MNVQDTICLSHCGWQHLRRWLLSTATAMLPVFDCQVAIMASMAERTNTDAQMTVASAEIGFIFPMAKRNHPISTDTAFLRVLLYI